MSFWSLLFLGGAGILGKFNESWVVLKKSKESLKKPIKSIKTQEIIENLVKSLKIFENSEKSNKILRNIRKSWKILENSSKS